ncbi:MAG: RNA polymerase sigma factor [Mesorhizobium sp.]|nr:MAG: RNA polymerase sigma factor [Mesorhizobium sp.]
MSNGKPAVERDRREGLLALAAALRPELHRYCARLMGSVIDGEDVVQDTFARAFVALDELCEVPQLRPWLFRIAHNRALDLLRSRAIRVAEPIEAALEIADEAEPLADIAALLGTTVDAVKGHLARGRARLRQINAQADPRPDARIASAAIVRYVNMFNQRDWDGLRALLADDVRLHQSMHPPRAGAADVGMFFTIYAKSDGLWLKPAWVEGREVIAVFEDRTAAKPNHFMWLEWREGRISFIRDYRYVRYILDDAELVLAREAGASRGGGGADRRQPDAGRIDA